LSLRLNKEQTKKAYEVTKIQVDTLAPDGDDSLLQSIYLKKNPKQYVANAIRLYCNSTVLKHLVEQETNFGKFSQITFADFLNK
jgi:hypothetical protein